MSINCNIYRVYSKDREIDLVIGAINHLHAAEIALKSFKEEFTGGSGKAVVAVQELLVPNTLDECGVYTDMEDRLTRYDISGTTPVLASKLAWAS